MLAEYAFDDQTSALCKPCQPPAGQFVLTLHTLLALLLDPQIEDPRQASPSPARVDTARLIRQQNSETTTGLRRHFILVPWTSSRLNNQKGWAIGVMFECYSCSLRFDKHSFWGSSSEWERQGWSWGGRHFKKEEGAQLKDPLTENNPSQMETGAGLLKYVVPESNNRVLHGRKAQAGFLKKWMTSWSLSSPCPQCVDQINKGGLRVPRGSLWTLSHERWAVINPLSP